jgi:glycine/D-amino acid oxidase-like deaminating enzyme
MMMASRLQLANARGILVLNAIVVEGFRETAGGVAIQTDRFEFESGKVLVATNGFASQLLDRQVKPARAQVLITKPIQGLHIKGTFHLDEGFFYFRDIDNRILLGGGRNLDFRAEETTDFGHTTMVMDTLENLLHEVILPGIPFEIDRYWSGIMGVGKEKNPIIEQVSEHIYCGVRLGGMGIAIGSLVGRDLADLVP